MQKDKDIGIAVPCLFSRYGLENARSSRNFSLLYRTGLCEIAYLTG